MLVGIFAGVTDWLDGYAARKLKVRTETGTYLDPAADKWSASFCFGNSAAERIFHRCFPAR